RPQEIEHDGSKPTLPAERHYLIPPALDDIVAQASSDYIRAFHTRNVIGHGNRWREGKIFKCAAKGDLSRYSRVLSDPVVGEHFTRGLRRWEPMVWAKIHVAGAHAGGSPVIKATLSSSLIRFLPSCHTLNRAPSHSPPASGVGL